MDKFLPALNNVLIDKFLRRKCILLWGVLFSFCSYAPATANIIKTLKNSAGAFSTEAELSGITISSGTLSPEFTAGTFNYVVTVDNAINSLTVTPLPGDVNLKIVVNNVVLTVGSPSLNILLNTGTNVINILTTNQDSSVSKTYVLTVNRALSSNAGLANLSLSNVTLTPSFSTVINSYTASITNTAANHIIYTMGDSITSDGGYQSELDSLLNHVFTFVNLGVSGDQTSGMVNRFQTGTKTPADYIIILGGVNDLIFDATAAQVEANLQTMYTYAHNNGIKVIALTILPWKGGAKWTPERQAVTDTVNTWIRSAAANLDYVVDGNAALSDPMDPQQLLPLYNRGDFKHPSSAGQKEIANVIYANTIIAPRLEQNISSTVVTPMANDTNATVKVNYVVVQPGAGSVSLPLNMGDNIITSVVTAQDGIATKTYTTTVTRNPSSNAGLSNIIINSGTRQLTPFFTESTTNYTMIATDVTSITVLPVAVKSGTTIKINGVNFLSASPLIIPLLQSSNTISIAATAEDGVTTRTYSITVTRINATLSNIIYSPAITKTTVTGNNYRDYTATVANTVAAVAVTPTLSDLTATIKVNGVLVKSGATSAPVPLNVGVNVINTIVTGQDSVTIKKYVLTITRLPSADATLSNITYSPAIIKTTVTGTNFKDYTATVANTFTSVIVTAALHDATASIKVNGVPVVSGVASAAIPLNVGPNIINTVVTAQDGTTTKNYSIVITRQPSTDATLSGITYSPAITTTLVTGTDYQDFIATVANSFTSIAVTPVQTDPGASIKVNGVPVVSGTASAAIPLNVGPNIINTVVAAQDGITTKNYSITITRQASTDATLSSITYSPAITTTLVTGADYQDFIATVANSFTSVTVTAVLHDATGSIKVNGVMLPSGLASAPIPLSVGANVINTVVTAQDGVTTQNYALTITRLPSADATLSNITYSPTIIKTTIAGTNFKDYVATVANTFTSVTVTAALHDAAASIKVNGVPVVSGTASAVIPLNVGANVINTVVTAQDGVTIKNYAITITRLPSNNATLSNITYSPAITKTTVAGADYRDYSATVVNTFTSIAVTPVLTDPGASIKVNGVPVVSGNASAQIPLSVGANIINTVVTAQDGITIKNYSITITRQTSTDATLSNITYSPAITKTTIAGADFRDYAATVANTFTSIAVTPVLHDGGASVKVNGVAVISGNTSALVPLNVGVNIINTVVTAQDGITTKSYSLSITRKEAGLAMQYGQQELQIISDKLTVHQNVSPNGDGNSDVLVIDGIADYPENKMQLMNRSGALIYEVKGYNNTTKAFDGHSSTNGKMQQAGTYFYSLEYKDGNEVKYRTGFIVLKY